MKTGWGNYLRIGISAFALFLGIHYWPDAAQLLGKIWQALKPLIVGLGIAYVLNILMSFYERHYFPAKRTGFLAVSRRPVCIVCAFLTVLGIVAVFFWIVIPALGSCLQVLLTKVPPVMERLLEELKQSELFIGYLAETLEKVDWEQTLTKALQLLSDGIGGTVSWAAGIAAGVADLAIGLIFSIYLWFSKDRLLMQKNRLQTRYLSEHCCQKIDRAGEILNDCFHSYLVGQCAEALILGSLCAVGMLILGFPYAMTTGIVVGVTALVPIAGAYIGGAVGFLLILTASPLKAMLFLVYLVVLQQIEGNLIYPKVVGNSLKLPGIWVFAAVTVGGGIYGIPGMILAVPVTAALYRMLRSAVEKKQA